LKIALLHYSYAPVVGGVEGVVERHARLFARAGHEVTTLVIPELRCDHPLSQEAQAEIDAGSPGPAFAKVEQALAVKFARLEVDILFIHNVLTMPFHLACTSALWKAAETTRCIGWIHDIAAANPDYALPFLERLPWRLLVSAHPAIEYVAVSEHRARAFEKLTGRKCEVVPNGVDPWELLDLTPPVAELAQKEKLLERDIVLLHPARILRRKNIELGLRVAAALKGCRYLVTGAPDTHNPASANYAAFLRALRSENAIFVNERFPVTRRDLSSLYRLADMLFFPSRQEGFGIPLLEAAVCGLPIACADVEPMNSLWPREDVTFFDPDGDPRALADGIRRLSRSSSIQNRKFAIRKHSWESIFTNYLEPLLANR